MKNVYVVRHCKADGQEPDAGLTDLGIQQTEIVAKFFLDKDIDFIISSPFERAYRTIAPLAEKIGIRVVLDDRLAERILSSQNHPDWRDMLHKTYDDLDLCYEGGESSNTAMSRAISVVMEVLNGEDKNIVFVSHGNLISLLLMHFDDRIGFKEWESLSNPDVFHLIFSADDKPNIHRIWE
ncbi:histidine phosphatase family protein [Paenibacillus sp. FSL H8-0548]|uniref:histidine phosphatase family protein n=1 Tax=Paenibacillus sp. FSL H8-0548 TaxID=1920422 RepID=UPI00096E3DCE|nr:histidine phosphatase family protein [Paenibacillus sp. FSL H8-0548]OMF28690.1 histidine phosphatase family protein [Paenibacillus sp. FSL H8-0548]